LQRGRDVRVVPASGPECRDIAELLGVIIDATLVNAHTEKEGAVVNYRSGFGDRTPFVGPPRVRVGGGYGSRSKVAARAVGSDRALREAGGSGRRGRRRGAERRSREA
jgi:hypothetical protein